MYRPPGVPEIARLRTAWRSMHATCVGRVAIALLKSTSHFVNVAMSPSAIKKHFATGSVASSTTGEDSLECDLLPDPLRV